MSQELAASFAEPRPEPDWSDREAVVDYIVEGLRPFSGSLPFDEEGQRALVERVVDRTINIASSMKNHWLLEDGEPVSRPLSEVTAPTLVLHGTKDPVFPYEHGEALAREIPGARLIPLEGAGHELPPRPLWNRSSRRSWSTRASRQMRMWRRSVQRCRRVPLRVELPLLALSRGNRVGVQAVCRHRAGEAPDHERRGRPSDRRRGNAERHTLRQVWLAPVLGRAGRRLCARRARLARRRSEPCGRRSTSSSAPRRHGSRSRTTYRNSRSTRQRELRDTSSAPESAAVPVTFEPLR